MTISPNLPSTWLVPWKRRLSAERRCSRISLNSSSSSSSSSEEEEREETRLGSEVGLGWVGKVFSLLGSGVGAREREGGGRRKKAITMEGLNVSYCDLQGGGKGICGVFI